MLICLFAAFIFFVVRQPAYQSANDSRPNLSVPPIAVQATFETPNAIQLDISRYETPATDERRAA